MSSDLVLSVANLGKAHYLDLLPIKPGQPHLHPRSRFQKSFSLLKTWGNHKNGGVKLVLFP
jgi:hypothetical protein